MLRIIIYFTMLLAMLMAGCGRNGRIHNQMPIAPSLQTSAPAGSAASPSGPDTEIAVTLDLAAESNQSVLSEELERQLSRAPAPPVPESLALDWTYDPDDFTLTFDYENPGDYNLDGEVSVADLTPLALNLGHIVGDGVGDETDAWLDGDGNCEVGISDITPIATRFQSRCAGFAIFHHNPDAEPP
ncbi:MAG: hypothetical protein HRF49_10985, partial [bacterium]